MTEPNPELEQLLAEMRQLLRRAYEMGVKSGSESTLRAVVTFASTATPRPIESVDRAKLGEFLFGDVREHTMNVQKPAEVERERSPPGAVQSMVRQIIYETPGLRQFKIIQRAAELGRRIPASSLRIAVTALTKQGVVMERDGHWFPVPQEGQETPAAHPPGQS